MCRKTIGLNFFFYNLKGIFEITFIMPVRNEKNWWLAFHKKRNIRNVFCQTII